MPERILAVCVGILLGVPVSYAALWIGVRWSLVDRPGAIKPHLRPTPYTGGAAMITVIVVGGLVFAVPFLALIGAAAAWLVGFVDDVRGLPPAWKLAATAVPLSIGVTSLGLQLPIALVAIFVGMILVNAFNVIDGLDGLAAGVALFALLPLVAMGRPLADLGAVSLGAIVGFLVLNLHPARLFMGDEGSLLLGYILWLLVVSLLAARPSPTSFAFAALMWAFPIVNAVFVLIKRARERRPLLAGDRGHLYDVLQRRYGLPVAVAISWGIAAVGSTLAAALRY